MGGVYQNALCNLGATKAQNGNNGLFSNRALYDIHPCVVKSAWYRSKLLPVPKKKVLCLTISLQ